MVYGAEAVLPCDIIHDSPRVRIYEEKEAELDRQDSLDALEEERDVAKARSAFYQQQARRYQSRGVRAKTYNIGELVLRLPEKKKRPSSIAGQFGRPGGGEQHGKGPFRILSATSSKVSKQRSTGQNL